MEISPPSTAAVGSRKSSLGLMSSLMGRGDFDTVTLTGLELPEAVTTFTSALSGAFPGTSSLMRLLVQYSNSVIFTFPMVT